LRAKRKHLRSRRISITATIPGATPLQPLYIDTHQSNISMSINIQIKR
jgi:hypothetical protein